MTGLFDEHHRELAQQSAISEEIIAGRGYRSISRPTNTHNEPREELQRIGIPKWAIDEDRYFPGLLIPLYRPTGERISHMYKPRVAVKNSSDKLMKYAAVKGRASVIDVHPINKDRIVDPTIPLWITEGVKKADALTTHGLCVAALSGVFNWRSNLGTVGDWEDIPLRGRTVIICFDADARTNPNVLRAMVRFGHWLDAKGVKQVHYLITPDNINGIDVKGADDFFAAGGTLDELRRAATTAPPKPDNTDDTFTDARLADTIADDVFDSSYCWAKGLDWLRWDRRRWTPCTDVTVGEAVRKYSLGRFGAAVRSTDRNTTAIDGWRTMLSAGRERSVTAMARGIVERQASHFDQQHDLLNTPSCVVDLETGDQIAHDPDLLMTKMTGVGYNPDAHHPDWDKALQAIPDDVRDYLQIRLGQALTGHPPPDDVLIVMQGGGKNGKTTIAATIAKVIGDYYVLVSERALMADPSAHPTELMDFMGKRYAVLEETPEARRLDTQRLKKTVGTPQITARYVRGNDITYDATHTLFINTNHRPVVDETDYGTWRRLQLIVYPYTFRAPYEQLKGPFDRHGDPGLRDRCLTDKNVWAAALAWLVEGAGKWYAAGKAMPEPPELVQRDTRVWRKESDLILGYTDDRLAFDADSHIMVTELLGDINAWLKLRGHQQLSERTFGARFSGHDEVAAHHVAKKKIRFRPGLSRAPMADNPWEYTPGPTASSSPYWAWLGVRFQGPNEGQHDEVSESSLNSENKDHVPTVPTLLLTPNSLHAKDVKQNSWNSWNMILEQSTGVDEPRKPDQDHVPAVPAIPQSTEKFGTVYGSRNSGNICDDCTWPTTTQGHYQKCVLGKTT